MFHRSKALIAASLFVSLVTVSTSAIAEERSVTVAYNDLNVDHPAGQSVLETRISSAAKQVCGRANGPTSLKEATQIRTCIEGAIDTAMASLNNMGQVQVAAR